MGLLQRYGAEAMSHRSFCPCCSIFGPIKMPRPKPKKKVEPKKMIFKSCKLCGESLPKLISNPYKSWVQCKNCRSQGEPGADIDEAIANWNSKSAQVCNDCGPKHITAENEQGRCVPCFHIWAKEVSSGVRQR